MERFTLVGVDGNAFSIMAYTAKCMRKAGLESLIDSMKKEAMSGDYSNLICVCNEYVEMSNDILGLEDDDEEE